MFYRVEPTRQALRDLAQVRRWLLQAGAGAVAREKLRQIQASIGELSLSPLRWPVGAHPDVRELPVEGYSVLYKVEELKPGAGTVLILRVFGTYQSRDFL